MVSLSRIPELNLEVHEKLIYLQASCASLPSLLSQLGTGCWFNGPTFCSVELRSVQVNNKIKSKPGPVSDEKQVVIYTHRPVTRIGTNRKHFHHKKTPRTPL
jgi:hypothetical protein